MRPAFAYGADPEATSWAHTGIAVYVTRWDEDRTSRPRAICSIDRGEFDRLLFEVLGEIRCEEDIGGC